MGVTNPVKARLTLRIDLGEERAIGPGKIRLLEAIRDTGSITQAGILLGMSYRRAWLLVDDMNNCFRDPVIEAQRGVRSTRSCRWLPASESFQGPKHARCPSLFSRSASAFP